MVSGDRSRLKRALPFPRTPKRVLYSFQPCVSAQGIRPPDKIQE